MKQEEEKMYRMETPEEARQRYKKSQLIFWGGLTLVSVGVAALIVRFLIVFVV